MVVIPSSSISSLSSSSLGYPPAEAASDRYHGVPKFDVATGRLFTIAVLMIDLIHMMIDLIYMR